MHDLKEVIMHLEMVRDWAICGKAPISGGIHYTNCESVEKWVGDALELLEAYEPVAVKWFTFKDDITDEEYQIPFCGACKYNVTDANYCPNCGRAVNWDE